MDRVLKNRGCACGSTRILAFRPFSVPSPPWKIASWLLSTLLTTHACNCDHESINHPKTKIFQIAFFYVDEKCFLSWWNGYFPLFDQRYRCSIMIVETCLIAKNSFLIKSVFWLLHCFHVTYPYMQTCIWRHNHLIHTQPTIYIVVSALTWPHPHIYAGNHPWFGTDRVTMIEPWLKLQRWNESLVERWIWKTTSTVSNC